MSIWDGVVVSPMQPVYEKPEDKKPEDIEFDGENLDNEEQMEDMQWGYIGSSIHST